MRTIVITYLVVLVVFTIVDFFWIGLVAIDFYKRELGSLMLPKPRLGPAVFFYALYAVGLTVIIVQPALNGGDWHSAVLLGAVFGFCAYGTYELTLSSSIWHGELC